MNIFCFLRRTQEFWGKRDIQVENDKDIDKVFMKNKFLWSILKHTFLKVNLFKWRTFSWNKFFKEKCRKNGNISYSRKKYKRLTANCYNQTSK